MPSLLTAFELIFPEVISAAVIGHDLWAQQ